MNHARHVREQGFTLIELMVVVLILGVLIAIAVPIYVNANALAIAKSCQANQRTIDGVIAMHLSFNAVAGSPTPAVLDDGGSVWYAIIVPAWIRTTPTCPADRAFYYLDEHGSVVGDSGATIAFKPGHQAP